MIINASATPHQEKTRTQRIKTEVKDAEWIMSLLRHGLLQIVILLVGIKENFANWLDIV